MKKFFLLFFLALSSCSPKADSEIKPFSRTSPLSGGDQAVFWINVIHPEKSVLIAAAKKKAGSLAVWDLSGKEVFKTFSLDEPVGVDIRYGIFLDGKKIDLAVTALAGSKELKVFAVDPEGFYLEDKTTEKGIPLSFVGKITSLCLYKSKPEKKLYAFVSSDQREDIQQILLTPDGNGKVKGEVVRTFGGKDTKCHIGSLLCDDYYGYLYCADESCCIRKYRAKVGSIERPISVFNQNSDMLKKDHVGMAFYTKPRGEGYMVISSQTDSTFKIFYRMINNKFIKEVNPQEVNHSQTVAVTSFPINPFYPNGIIACHDSDGESFALYEWFDFTGLD